MLQPTPQKVAKDATHDPTRTPHDNVIKQVCRLGCPGDRAFRATMAAKREGEILGLTAVLPVATAKFGMHRTRRGFVHVQEGL